MVPDRYPSAGTLDREFGMDNRRFYAALRTRGFAVSENAHANYPKTFLSLASTLNGGYLESFAASYGAGSGDKRPVHDALEGSRSGCASWGTGFTITATGGSPPASTAGRT